MKPKLDNICKDTGKIIYSESAASRAVDKVDGARRYYKCDSCKGFHITKLGHGLAKILGFEKTKRSGKISIRRVERRIKHLKRKLENEFNKNRKGGI